MKQKKLVVIGGGAAGFFCAINAARQNSELKVILLEKTGKLLQKVRISGGGRCNTTHHLFEISSLSKRYPRGEKFLKKAFHQFSSADTVTWFKERGVTLKTEPDGRMFPTTDSSQTIINCLLQEAEKFGVEIRLHASVLSIHQEEDGWNLQLLGQKTEQADFVCVAGGGFPKSGQFDWLTNHTQHTVVEPVPSLFTFNIPGHAITSLMGVATPARVKITGTRFESEGPLLITHWGLSGPVVLRTSAFAARFLAGENYHFQLTVNWMPAYQENSLRELILEYRQHKGSQKVLNSNWVDMPSRLWAFLLSESGISLEERWATLPAPLQNKLIKNICSYSLEAKGKTTFKEEFVTAGGIALEHINPSTMESRLHSGLFFAGEIMDVDGITGGFNFQHAWTSGFIAAAHISRKNSNNSD